MKSSDREQIMDETLQTLGQRIVQAARMAMAEHLRQSELESVRPQPEWFGGAEPRLSKDGEFFSTDGEQPLGNDRPRRSLLAGKGAE